MANSISNLTMDGSQQNGVSKVEADSNALPTVTDQNGERKRNGIYLLTCPRSASNMFQTMLAKQEKFRHSGYWFFGGNMAALPHLPSGKWADLPEDLRTQLYGIFQQGYDGLMEEFQRAKDEGKEALVKEHAVLLYGPEYFFQLAHGKDGTPPFIVHSKDDPNPKHTNPTMVPDEVLLSLQPIFQIRHPGLMFPSMARAEMDTGKADGPMDPRVHIFIHLWYSRQLYEWYLNTPGALAPKVISADDIMTRPDVVRQLCVETGMDPDAMAYEWETREAPKGNKEIERFASTIYASKGILPGYDSQGFDIKEKRPKWREEFGEEAGDFLADMVEKAMPDYEWLMERRVKV